MVIVVKRLISLCAGDQDLFPEAKVLVQEAELLRYAIAPGRFFRKSFLSPLSRLGNAAVPGSRPGRGSCRQTTSILPGLRVVPAPGHTPGSQAVVDGHGRTVRSPSRATL